MKYKVMINRNEQVILLAWHDGFVWWMEGTKGVVTTKYPLTWVWRLEKRKCPSSTRP